MLMVALGYDKFFCKQEKMLDIFGGGTLAPPVTDEGLNKSEMWCKNIFLIPYYNHRPRKSQKLRISQNLMSNGQG